MPEPVASPQPLDHKMPGERWRWNDEVHLVPDGTHGNDWSWPPASFVAATPPKTGDPRRFATSWTHYVRGWSALRLTSSVGSGLRTPTPYRQARSTDLTIPPLMSALRLCL